MKIVYNDIKPAYMPEIDQYISYANSLGYEAYRLSAFKPEAADVYWDFMGFQILPTMKSKIIVHEYCSGSVGKFKKSKNFLKKQINLKPHIRVFLNPYVASLFSFNDGVPSLYRDMGISYPNIQVEEKAGIVCVVNSANHSMLESFLKLYSLNDVGLKLAIVGRVNDSLIKTYESDNISFLGVIEKSKYMNMLSAFEYGVVMYENTEPFCYQTSTRVLDYCAANLKIVATPTNWISDFMLSRNGSFCAIESFNNFDFDKILTSVYRTPKVDDLEWRDIIKKSNIFDLISKSLNKI